jgi:phytoene synthase
MSMHDLVAYSRRRIEEGSKSFALAARLFAPETRASAYMLYAWCRHCDDIVDGQELGHPATRRLDASTPSAIVDRLEAETRAALAGNPSDPTFEALGLVCARHDIDKRYPLELIEGFRMDAASRTYETFEDTLEYCYHVAGVVGVMMAMVMGVREAQVLARASDLGIAFQLTNIARDIIADHRADRVYLPSEWLTEQGLSPADLAEPDHRERLFVVTERLLDAAEPYYASGRAGLAHLPFRAAWAVAAAGAVYRDIGTLVRQRGPRAWDERVSTSRTRKFSGVAAGLAAALARPRADAAGLPPRAGPSRQGLWTPSSLRHE